MTCTSGPPATGTASPTRRSPPSACCRWPRWPGTRRSWRTCCSPRWPSRSCCSRLAGVGTGLAAAVKLTPAVFIAYLLVTGRWRAAATAIGTAVAATTVTAALAPEATRTFFTEALWDTDRVGRLAYVSNQSVLGVVARLDPTHPDRRLWVALVAVVLVVWATRVRRAVRNGDERAGFAVTGVVACLVSPVTWVHHLVWLVPGLVVIAASTLPWPPADPTARRRARAGVAGYVVLCSGLVWVFANGSVGPLGFLGANAYVWVSVGMLVLLPVGHASPVTANSMMPQRHLDAGVASGSSEDMPPRLR
ncbi:glycosyltransferase 87 family protein [Micromonospora taraxaci]